MEQEEECILLFKSGKYTVSALAQMFDISQPGSWNSASSRSTPILPAPNRTACMSGYIDDQIGSIPTTTR